MLVTTQFGRQLLPCQANEGLHLDSYDSFHMLETLWKDLFDTPLPTITWHDVEEHTKSVSDERLRLTLLEIIHLKEYHMYVSMPMLQKLSLKYRLAFTLFSFYEKMMKDPRSLGHELEIRDGLEALKKKMYDDMFVEVVTEGNRKVQAFWTVHFNQITKLFMLLDNKMTLHRSCFVIWKKSISTSGKMARRLKPHCRFLY